jgi:hypothetical protein
MAHRQAHCGARSAAIYPTPPPVSLYVYENSAVTSINTPNHLQEQRTYGPWSVKDQPFLIRIPHAERASEAVTKKMGGKVPLAAARPWVVLKLLQFCATAKAW